MNAATIRQSILSSAAVILLILKQALHSTNRKSSTAVSFMQIAVLFGPVFAINQLISNIECRLLGAECDIFLRISVSTVFQKKIRFFLRR